MSVPIILPNGSILVYGWGTARDGSEGFVTPSTQRFVFGTVYQIWDGGSPFIYGGDQVMWKDGSELCKLVYAGKPYTFLEFKAASKQQIIP